ncbi:MAG: uroporphyrinogen III methyltransferase [Bacteroidia bacterium]|nr:MAG: uroporphyrinogen III methyltransferase [Bacteroidia bacterium]
MYPKVKNILITQSAPLDENSPYKNLEKKFKVKIEYKSFIDIEGLSVSEFRKQNLHPLDFTAVILTSKHAVDNYFRLCKELRVELPADMKYFCISNTTAQYLQKYIVIRKRKLFVGTKTAEDLIELVKKHPKDKYIFPCSDMARTELTKYMHENGFSIKEAIVYKTVYSDLSEIKNKTFDLIAFFSPSAIESLFKNFPDYQQNNTRIAVFGPTTAQAANEKGLKVDIEAPQPNLPSMAMAIEHYLQQCEK